jgi:penicillin-binding protein 2
MNKPKIAIAVYVENAGFGATWAVPIASVLMEKYLKGTLSPERMKTVDEISNTNLIQYGFKEY